MYYCVVSQSLYPTAKFLRDLNLSIIVQGDNILTDTCTYFNVFVIYTVNLNGDNVYFSANDESDKEGYQIRTKWNNSNLLCTKPHNHLIPTVLYWSADCNGTCNDTRHHQVLIDIKAT